MAVVHQSIRRPPEAVYDALTTPETYPHWLVGCRDIRDVDDGWPEPGTAFHHRVGVAGPLTVADLSRVLEVDAPRRLVLEVRARPFGRGRATFTIEADGPSSSLVALDEVPIGALGPARPVLDPLTARRNQRSLRNLSDLLEEGESHRPGPG